LVPSPSVESESMDEPAATQDQVDAEVAQSEPVLVCAEVGNFNVDDAKRFIAQLAPLALGERVAQQAASEVTSHIVYIPSQANREGAEKKADELRQLGITDFFIIQDESSLRWGISLGVFKQEDAARTHLARLTERGVRSARIGRRSRASGLIAFQLRDLDVSTRSAIEKIKDRFPRQEMRACT
jgi:cell division septation protein DedD